MFVRLAAAAGIVCLAGVVYASIHVARFGDQVKVVGWTAAYKTGNWSVKAVDPAGPAAGKLERGDRVLAINGDRRAERIGPGWFLRDSRDAGSYMIRTVRDGVEREQRIAWPTVHVAGVAPWLWMYLLTALTNLTVGLFIAFARPDSESGRMAALSAGMNCLFFTMVAMNFDSGMLSGAALAFTCAINFIRPYHLVVAYRFLSTFPSGDASTGLWRAFDRFIYAAAFLLWAPVVYGMSIRAMGPERAAAIAAPQFPFSLLYDSFVDSAHIAFTAIMGVANALVCLRNYRLVQEGDVKRRIRWVSIGAAAGLLPIAVAAPLLVVGTTLGRRAEILTLVRAVNCATIMVPLCIGYAIIKHRVLGIRVILRAGIQYVLAKNVLRAALLLPIASIAVSIATHPHAAAADFFNGAAGKVNLMMLALGGLALAFRTALLQRIDRHFFREAYRQDQIFVRLSEAIGRAADIGEISRLLSSEIQSALHPQFIFAVSRETGDGFTVVYSSSSGSEPRPLSDFRVYPSTFEGLDESADILAIASNVQDYAILDGLGVRLLVPIRGPNEGLLGMLLLGEKRSEEPYTPNDRRLLETAASQTGIVWENLQLRQRLKQERDVRQRVVARMDGHAAEMVMECPACGTCYDATAAVCESDGRQLTPTLPISRVIDGKYRLCRLIGRGGMGAVYEALDLRLDRSVAVKVTTSSLFGDASALQRFTREARASAKLDHPNVVRVFDFGEFSSGGAYLVLEYLRGVTLRREIRERGPFAPDQVSGILIDICRGIEAAHERGVIHRDLKPENIFLIRESADARPVAKILDFGLAAVRDLNFSDRRKLTRTGVAVGTLAYMSREQFLGESVDERTDIYSLGIVVLETISGSLDLQGPSFAQVESALEQRLRGPSSAPEHHELFAILRRAVLDDRSERYQSVREFREALVPVLERCPPVPKAATAAAASQLTSVETSTQIIPPDEKRDE